MAGSYDLRFEDPGDRYLTEWYDDTYFYVSRTPVVVAENEALVGIDAQLSEGGSISGTVTDVNGDPVEGIEVSTSDGWSLTTSDGSYLITGLIPGSYAVFFRDVDDVADRGYLSEWYDDADNEDSATPVVVADGEVVAGIDAELSVGGSISGRVTDEAGDPLALIHVMLGPVYGEAVTEADGSYRINGLVAGSYTVRFADTQDRYLTEWFDDATDEASATPVAVAQGATVSGIDAQLALGGSISGTVTDQAGDPIADVFVGLGEPDFKGTYTGADGSYQITGLAAGSYTVRFADMQDRYATEWFDDATDEASATPVAVAQGATVSGIDAQLALGGSISGTVTDQAGDPIANVYRRAGGAGLQMDIHPG